MSNVDKIETSKTGLKSSKYISKPNKEEDKSGYNYFLEMKQRDIEQKRASQRNHEIYCLSLKAKDGDCSAIKKLINYSFKAFNLSDSFAQKLDKEAGEMLDEQVKMYMETDGVLTDNGQKAALEEVQKNYKCQNEAEEEQQVNDLMDKMTCGYSAI